MLNLSNVRIFLRPGATDMRKQINGLSLIVEAGLNKNPLSGNLFLFCNRTRKIVKILYRDKKGRLLALHGIAGISASVHVRFCLWQKKLNQDKFPWPMNDADILELNRDQLLMLLGGIDFFRQHKKLNFKSVV